MLTPETMLIVAGAAFLLFGGKKLPELGRSLGDGIREFRSGTQGLKAELENSAAPALSQSVQVPVSGTVQLRTVQLSAPTAIILPSAPVTRTIQLGEPPEQETVAVGRTTD